MQIRIRDKSFSRKPDPWKNKKLFNERKDKKTVEIVGREEKTVEVKEKKDPVGHASILLTLAISAFVIYALFPNKKDNSSMDSDVEESEEPKIKQKTKQAEVTWAELFDIKWTRMKNATFVFMLFSVGCFLTMATIKYLIQIPPRPDTFFKIFDLIFDEPKMITLGITAFASGVINSFQVLHGILQNCFKALEEQKGDCSNSLRSSHTK